MDEEQRWGGRWTLDVGDEESRYVRSLILWSRGRTDSISKGLGGGGYLKM
jgi:hypothetical protein